MNKLNKESVIGISALLVHAAKIDENYSEHERNLIKAFGKVKIFLDDKTEILLSIINFLSLKKGSPILTPICFASSDREITQPSLFESIITGFSKSLGLNNLSHET